MQFTYAIVLAGFAYSGYASYLAYRESGDKWMLIQPTWIDEKCGVSRRVRTHGKVAFGVLFVGIGLLLFGI